MRAYLCCPVRRHLNLPRRRCCLVQGGREIVHVLAVAWDLSWAALRHFGLVVVIAVVTLHSPYPTLPYPTLTSTTMTAADRASASVAT